MGQAKPELATGSLIASSLQDVLRPPFVSLLILNLLLTLASSSLTGEIDGTGFVLWVILSALSVFVDIATVLVAGAAEPVRSADPWIKASFRIRCFWRFLGVEILTFVLVALGLFLLVIGGFAVGAYLALGAPAVVLERKKPLRALSHSAEMSEGRRLQLGVIFGVLIIVPNAGLQVAYALNESINTVVWMAANAAGVVLMTAGTIAITRAFVRLGGATSPPAGEIRVQRAARP